MIVNIIYVPLHMWTNESSRSNKALRSIAKRISLLAQRETQIRVNRKPHHMLYAFRPRKKV